MTAVIRSRDYSQKTEAFYLDWIYRYIAYHQRKHPCQMGTAEVAAFLGFLAMERQVSAATQRQALNALLFLYRIVLNAPLQPMDLPAIASGKRLPVVLTKAEIKRVLDELEGEARLMAALLYGCGLRVAECTGLRVKDIDFVRNAIFVAGSKSSPERTVPLPHALRERLETQIAGEWGREYLFPAARKDGHKSESTLQKALKEAFHAAGIVQRASCNTLRHSYGVHLLEAGYDARVVQRLMGHKTLRTTMAYTQILDHGQMQVPSPIDGLV